MNCQHEGCHCQQGTTERNGRHYCSEACASAGPSPGGSCGCGHAGCGGASAKM
jgi:hypothetical protein